MADSGVFRINPLQSWQRDAILKAAQLLRDRFGNPPVDAQARSAHDGLLEVLDPARRTVRLQKELSEAGAQGYEFVGVTVSDTAFGGKEVVSILRRPVRK